MPERSSQRNLAIAAVAIATLIWGSVGVLVKTTAISGLTFAMYRLWLGALLHLGGMAVMRRRLSWATFRACAPGGALFALDIGLAFTAVKLTTVANAAIIGALAPVLIAFASARWLGERIGRRERALAAAALGGGGRRRRARDGGGRARRRGGPGGDRPPRRAFEGPRADRGARAGRLSSASGGWLDFGSPMYLTPTEEERLRGV